MTIKKKRPLRPTQRRAWKAAQPKPPAAAADQLDLLPPARPTPNPGDNGHAGRSPTTALLALHAARTPDPKSKSTTALARLTAPPTSPEADRLIGEARAPEPPAANPAQTKPPSPPAPPESAAHPPEDTAPTRAETKPPSPPPPPQEQRIDDEDRGTTGAPERLRSTMATTPPQSLAEILCDALGIEVPDELRAAHQSLDVTVASLADLRAAILEVTDRVMHHTIDPQEARLLLYALQTAVSAYKAAVAKQPIGRPRSQHTTKRSHHKKPTTRRRKNKP